MRFAQDTVSGANIVRAYTEGELTINQEVVRSSVVVMPERLIRDWAPESVDDLEEDHVAELAALGVEIVLIGTGRHQRFPPLRLIAPLTAQGIGVEVMDTAAACRTYNILLSEDRSVAAALFMI
ncbi:MAG: Mth938-like domain-containing protein [Gammaproteobacteria bacterium]